MARIDIYRAVHEGTRALLLGVRHAAHRAAATQGVELEPAALLLGRLDPLLRAEAARHDEHVLPHLARLAPVLAAELETRYDRCEGYAEELARLCQRVAGANTSERASLASRLERLVDLHEAEHLARIELEAADARPTLVAGLGNDGLERIEAEIEASLSDAERAARHELVRSTAAAATELAPQLGSEPTAVLTSEPSARQGGSS